MDSSTKASSSRHWWKSILAVVVGYIIYYLLGGIFGLIPIIFEGTLINSLVSWLRGVPYVTLLAFIVSLVSGYVTARIAPRAPVVHALIIGIMPAIFIILSTVFAVTVSSIWPEFLEQLFSSTGVNVILYWAPIILGPIPGALLGGYLRKRQLRRRGNS